MRSKWKLSLIKNDNFNISIGKTVPSSSIITTILRAPKIMLNSNMVNNRVEIYNGKKLLSILVRGYMVGKRLSNFVSSKYSGKVIHVKRKKRIKKK